MYVWLYVFLDCTRACVCRCDCDATCVRHGPSNGGLIYRFWAKTHKQINRTNNASKHNIYIVMYE